ncbi:MAG: lamin tail domain-containing protein, partial [Verrucomicrobiota bacterium]
ENPEYHLRFADRVVKHLYNDGCLTPEGAAASWNGFAARVYEALIGESARWGDLHISRPETREGNWQTQMDKENELWFPGRTEVLLDQLAGQGFIDSRLIFPKFTPHGGPVNSGQTVAISAFNANIFNPARGDLIYTTNGEDPRQADGSVHPDARPYNAAQPPTITRATTIMSRLYDGSTAYWSPVTEAYFHLGALPTTENLGITEIHYQPTGPDAEESAAGYKANDFEFIELVNKDPGALDISGLQITNGVDVVVEDSDQALIPPGETFLLVANREAFQSRYPEVSANRIASEFSETDNLDNGGERITIRNRNGLLLHTLRFNDKSPWPVQAESAGQSLTFVGEAGPSIAHPGNWIASGTPGGTPGRIGEDDPNTGGVTLTDWLAAEGFEDALTPVGTSGIPALLFYALGGDPQSESSGTIALPEASPNGLTLTHPVRAESRGLVWSYEFSSDLQTWTGQAPLSRETQAGAAIVRFPGADAISGYWRLRVSAE